ncbi:cytochrome P450 4C1-like protein [Leptotrombidium deliense]|uniref:Cytochrome P450 4C1-like protein n=1 Tax=Leptotrombidium deliense TaxID=299467 RepID=A0A443RSE2_9ACAR|nr:cytochrome P450 4C1-like protein [Leptotrombidium deliense]
MSKHFRHLVETVRKEVGKPVDLIKYAQLVTLDVICETVMGVSINAQSGLEPKYVNCVMSVEHSMFERFLLFTNWFDFIYFRREGGKKKKILLKQAKKDDNNNNIEAEKNGIHVNKKSEDTLMK